MECERRWLGTLSGFCQDAADERDLSGNRSLMTTLGFDKEGTYA
jgi:hypothetical protein